MIDREWTDVELDRLRTLDAAHASIAEMAAALGRRDEDIGDRLTLVRLRKGGVSGPDEEGDVPPPRDGDVDDPAAWVHVDRK